MALDAEDLALVDAVARRVVEVLREEGAEPLKRPRLLTVAEVAAEYGVSTDWVYNNARQLGAIRLGSGPKPRLRFERATIDARIADIGSRWQSAQPSPRAARRRSTQDHQPADLLPIHDRGA